MALIVQLAHELERQHIEDFLLEIIDIRGQKMFVSGQEPRKIEKSWLYYNWLTLHNTIMW